MLGTEKVTDTRLSWAPSFSNSLPPCLPLPQSLWKIKTQFACLWSARSGNETCSQPKKWTEKSLGAASSSPPSSLLEPTHSLKVWQTPIKTAGQKGRSLHVITSSSQPTSPRLTTSGLLVFWLSHGRVGFDSSKLNTILVWQISPGAKPLFNCMSMLKKQSQKKRQEGAAGDSCNKELDTMGYEIKQ